MCFGTDLDLKFPKIQNLKGISISCHLKKVNVYVLYQMKQFLQHELLSLNISISMIWRGSLGQWLDF